MDFAVLREILTTELGGKRDGDAITIQGRVSLILDTGGMNPMAVDRVRGVRLVGHYLEVDTDESRLFVEESAVTAVKSEKNENLKDSRPGFH